MIQITLGKREPERNERIIKGPNLHPPGAFEEREEVEVLEEYETEDAYGNTFINEKKWRVVDVAPAFFRIVTNHPYGSRYTYRIEPTDSDDPNEWEVVKRTKNNHPNELEPESTQAVREHVREEHGIKLVN